MASTLTKVLLHITYSTKDREPLIAAADEPDLYAYIGGVCRNLHSPLLDMGGTTDHVHMLVSIAKSISLADLMLNIKRDSSKWMSTRPGRWGRLAWQEGNFAFSTQWFPFDQGWLGGDVAGPTAEGGAAWTGVNNHAAGLTPGLIKWTEFPAGAGTYGGLAHLVLPGVNSLEDGMLFTSSSDGAIDVNVVGVVPNEDGSGWTVTIREASATDG